MATRLNYLGAVERIKTVVLAHPQVNSADDGRELEFDTKKTDQFPRAFVRTDTSSVLGGDGSAQMTVSFSVLVMDRVNTKRNNHQDVLNTTHSIGTDIMATLNKEQIIRLEDNPSMEPLIDYQDTQTAGWILDLTVYLDSVFQCYDVA